MERLNDRRKNARIDAFFKVYNQGNMCGFLVDLSQGGMKFWLGKNRIDNSSDFDVKFLSPDEFSIEPIHVAVKQIWKIPDKSSLLEEMGCQIKDCKSNLSDPLGKLMTYLDFFHSIDDFQIEIDQQK